MGTVPEYVKELMTLMLQTQACWLCEFGEMEIATLHSQNLR